MSVSFTLYNYVLSGNCYKVRLLAALLGVNYETVAVDFHPGKEHQQEKFLSLNPAATLPVLVFDETVLTETQAMLVWLAETHDASGLWWPTKNPHEIVSVLQWLGFSSRLSATVGELRLHSMLNKVIDVDSARSGAIKVLRELESHLTEQRLLGMQWLTGDHPTVADIACFPYAALSPDAGIEHDDYPAIRSWMHALRSLDRFLTMPGIHELHELRSEQGERL